MAARTGMTDRIHQIEELSLTAWPALQTAFYDGWVLRFGGGFTRRANSINAVYPSTLDTAEKIARCAALYKARGIRPVFKMTAGVQPPDLDSILEQQGYQREGATSVQTLDLTAFTAPNMPPADLQSDKSADWVAACVAFNAFDPTHARTLSRILDNMVAEHRFARIVENGAIIAVGLGVQVQDHLALFDIATAPEQRNRGLARRVVASLLGWGQAQGAQTAFLQVVPQNAPAMHLYARFGFRELYPYWYRA